MQPLQPIDIGAYLLTACTARRVKAHWLQQLYFSMAIEATLAPPVPAVASPAPALAAMAGKEPR